MLCQWFIIIVHYEKSRKFFYHEPEACLKEARHSAENFKSAEMSEYQGCINLTIISSMSSASESETFGVTKTSHGRRSRSLLCKLGSSSTVGHFFLWDESDSMLKNAFLYASFWTHQNSPRYKMKAQKERYYYCTEPCCGM